MLVKCYMLPSRVWPCFCNTALTVLIYLPRAHHSKRGWVGTGKLCLILPDGCSGKLSVAVVIRKHPSHISIFYVKPSEDQMISFQWLCNQWLSLCPLTTVAYCKSSWKRGDVLTNTERVFLLTLFEGKEVKVLLVLFAPVFFFLNYRIKTPKR